MKFIKNSHFKLPFISKISYIAAAIFIFLGYYLIFVVNKSNEYEAYEYILNSNYANGYFIISLLLVCFGSTFFIVEAIKSNKNADSKE